MFNNDTSFKIESTFRNLATIILIGFIVTPFTSTYGWPYAVIIFQVLTLIMHRKLFGILKNELPEDDSKAFSRFTTVKRVEAYIFFAGGMTIAVLLLIVSFIILNPFDPNVQASLNLFITLIFIAFLATGCVCCPLNVVAWKSMRQAVGARRDDVDARRPLASMTNALIAFVLGTAGLGMYTIVFVVNLVKFPSGLFSFIYGLLYYPFSIASFGLGITSFILYVVALFSFANSLKDASLATRQYHAPVQPTDTKTFCPYCGSKLPASIQGLAFCPACGKPVS